MKLPKWFRRSEDTPAEPTDQQSGATVAAGLSALPPEDADELRRLAQAIRQRRQLEELDVTKLGLGEHFELVADVVRRAMLGQPITGAEKRFVREVLEPISAEITITEAEAFLRSESV
jgi:hypothetical protein